MNIYEYNAKAVEFKKLTDSIANKEFIENSVNAITSKFKDKFALPEYLFYKGYTPGFNDGEPCTHSAYWVDFNEFAESYEGDCEGLCEAIGFELPEGEDFDDVEVYDLPVNVAYETDKNKLRDEYLARTGERYGYHEDIRAFDCELSMLDDIIDNAYHTDFLIVFKRGEDGLYTLTHQDYECGY